MQIPRTKREIRGSTTEIAEQPLFIFFILCALVFPASSPVYAAGITVKPLIWNIIGLDSNEPTDGPNYFPVGGRVCNDTGGPISNVKADFKWDSTTNSTYIFERPGTATSVTMFDPTEPALANGDCVYELNLSS